MEAGTSAIANRKEVLEKELKRIVPLLVEEYQPERIILFGSLVSGKMDEWSDIDLLIVVKESNRRPLDRALEAYSLLGDYKEPIDLFVYTSAEIALLLEEGSSFVAEILARGKVLV